MDPAMAGDLRRKKERWSDLPPRLQTAIVLGGIAELVRTLGGDRGGLVGVSYWRRRDGTRCLRDHLVAGPI